MRKGPKWAAIAAIVVFAAISALGAYNTWSECSKAGGTTVRGLFGLECIN